MEEAVKDHLHNKKTFTIFSNPRNFIFVFHGIKMVEKSSYILLTNQLAHTKKLKSKILTCFSLNKNTWVFLYTCASMAWTKQIEENHFDVSLVACVPSNFMANRQVPKFSLNNCAQSSKKTFMCPKFCTNSVLKYTKCHISTNLSNFLKLCSLYCQKLFALAPTNHRFAEKNRLSGNTACNSLCQIEL